jgi:hypothetical protein
MKHKNKPITKELIKKYFGKNAKVHGFAGHYRVTTPTGGKVTITQSEVKLIYGGDDVYRAMTLLMGECWGSGKVRGSREFMLAFVAHGEASGVNIQPDFRDSGATFARWVVAMLLFVVGCMVADGMNAANNDTTAGGAILFVLLGPFLVFSLMKRAARREEQRKLETGGFTYPRQAQGAEYANDDDLRKGGLI